MTETEKKIKEPYFVPLGREAGGYLEILGLDPGADQKQAGAAEKQFRRRIKQEIRDRQKNLKNQLDANEITKEEFEQGRKENESEQTRRLMEINKLKKSYAADQGKRRENAQKGIVDDKSTWFNVYPETGDCATVLASLLNDSVLAPGAQPKPSEEMHIRSAYLSWTDGCWAKLQWTNRDVWSEKVLEWVNEMHDIQAEFHVRPEKVGPVNVLFPELCWPGDRSIQSLKNDKMEDFSKKPERKGDGPDVDLAGLLERMLKERATAKRTVPGKGVDIGFKEKSMLALLKMLEMAAEKGKK